MADLEPTEKAQLDEDRIRQAIAKDIRRVFSDRRRQRPLRTDATSPTDFADDAEWAAMIAEGSA